MADKSNIASRLVDRHEKLAVAARKLDALLKEFPELAAELEAEFANPRVNSESKNGHQKRQRLEKSAETESQVEDREKRSLTNVERLSRFFIENGNEFVATPEIPNISGLDKKIVANAIYSPKGQKVFEQQSVKEDNKTKKWRLKPDEFQRLKRLEETTVTH